MIPRFGRYFWKLFLMNAAFMAVVPAVCVWIILFQFDRFYKEELTHHLLARASTLEATIQDRFDDAHVAELMKLADELGRRENEGVRFTLVLSDGRVVGDSQADPREMDSHVDRPEIRQALVNGLGESTRWSHTLSKYFKYVAIRVGSADAPLGVVRLAMALPDIRARVAPAQRLMVSIALVSVAAAVLFALVLAFLWSHRITRITRAAQHLSQGDLTTRVVVSGRDEVAALGRAIEDMREHLADHLETIDRQRRTLDSLLSQLREGVIVADGEGRIVLINTEAVKLLQLMRFEPEGGFLGKTVEQCVRQRRLQDMLCPALRLDPCIRKQAADESRETIQEAELQIETATAVQSLLARAFDVRLPGKSRGEGAGDSATVVGRALVLTDVTELTRVMQVKADLAANASHELRTPVSAIRAAVETLRMVDWAQDPRAASQFIDMVDRQSGRMESMICDLLALSCLESGSDRFVAPAVSIRQILKELHMAFVHALTLKKIKWKTVGVDECSVVTASPELLRMVLRNLIDNAIQFTEPEGTVTISVRLDEGSLVIEVADTGCGIPSEEQSRVFERFYQVGRARTGRERGTGLGLSIVRHAVVAMNAHVELQSDLGRGTRVAVTIPQAG